MDVKRIDKGIESNYISDCMEISSRLKWEITIVSHLLTLKHVVFTSLVYFCARLGAPSSLHLSMWTKSCFMY